jgi:hypothetical protein
VETLTAHFARRCREVCLIPWDPSLVPGGRTTLASLRPRTRRALLELAAAVVDGFDTPRRSVTPAPPAPPAPAARPWPIPPFSDGISPVAPTPRRSTSS